MKKSNNDLIDIKKLLGDDSFADIIGLKKEKEDIKSALISSRHLILVGPPGIGKTSIAKNIAKILDDAYVTDSFTKEKSKEKISGEKRFVRVQGSPDLTAEDLIGDIDPIKALKFGPLSIEAFTPGKIFKANEGVLFFDEVNRCTEKLQNSLLQVLEEGVVTISGYPVDIPSRFILIATMNPDDTSTEPLSDVFMDRFDVIYIGYPSSIDDEKKIVLLKGKKLDVDVNDALLHFMVLFVRNLRESDKIQKKPSVRATLGLYERSQANALIAARRKINLDDIQRAVVSVLSHRIELKPSIKFLQKPEDFIREHFENFRNQFSSLDEEGDSP